MSGWSDVSLASILQPTEEDLQGYRALQQDAALLDASSLTQIEATGRDRGRFLHNLCTNDLLKLTPGQGCESFITNVQGKTIGHGFFFCEAERFVFVTVPGQQEKLIAHWDRYLITEDVQLVDRSQAEPGWLVAGPQAAMRLQRVLGEGLHLADSSAAAPSSVPGMPQTVAHSSVPWNEERVTVRQLPWLRTPAWLVCVAESHWERLGEALQNAGVAPVSPAAFHMARVEAGYPWFGWDVTDKNLPQEVDRNERAISFRKGCYLGQETVARLDALGHVNRLLTLVESIDTLSAADAVKWTHEGQEIGEVTSSAYSPARGRGLALAYVRYRPR